MLKMSKEVLEIVGNNTKFLRNRIDELKKFVGKYVAIYNGEIVGFDEDYVRLLDTLRKKGVDIRFTHIEYVPDEEYLLVI